MRAIVTGGAGFIGSHVVDALLARSDEVHVVDDLSTGRADNIAEGASLVVGDVRDPLGPVFDSVRPELCFHLAAQASVAVSVERPEYDAEVNVLGTLRVLEAARLHGTKVVFSSTGGAIYGECDGPVPETAGLRPLSPYGASKAAAEEYIAAYSRLHGTGHVNLRYANVYGPRQDPHGEAGVVAIFFGRLADGRPGRIFGDGLHVRDYVFVEDVVRATLAAGARDGGTYNIGTGRETTTLELYNRCRTVAGVDLEPEFGPPRAGDLRRSVLDATLAERDLGWRPEVGLDEGLRATWGSFASRKERGPAKRI